MGFAFRNDYPIYLQLVDHIKKAIVSGTYESGTRLPSIREMSAQFEVTPNTVQRALQILESEELIYTERTTGKFVTKDEERLIILRREILAERVHGMISELKLHGYSKEEIIDSVRKELVEYDD